MSSTFQGLILCKYGLFDDALDGCDDLARL